MQRSDLARLALGIANALFLLRCRQGGPAKRIDNNIKPKDNTMSKHTFHDRLCAGLVALGARLDTTDRSKYTAFISNSRSDNRKYFVGALGALRRGHCASDSFSIGSPTNMNAYYTLLLTKGDRALWLQDAPLGAQSLVIEQRSAIGYNDEPMAGITQREINSVNEDGSPFIPY